MKAETMTETNEHHLVASAAMAVDPTDASAIVAATAELVGGLVDALGARRLGPVEVHAYGKEAALDYIGIPLVKVERPPTAALLDQENEVLAQRVRRGFILIVAVCNTRP